MKKSMYLITVIAISQVLLATKFTFFEYQKDVFEDGSCVEICTIFHEGEIREPCYKYSDDTYKCITEFNDVEIEQTIGAKEKFIDCKQRYDAMQQIDSCCSLQ